MLPSVWTCFPSATLKANQVLMTDCFLLPPSGRNRNIICYSKYYLLSGGIKMYQLTINGPLLMCKNNNTDSQQLSGAPTQLLIHSAVTATTCPGTTTPYLCSLDGLAHWVVDTNKESKMAFLSRLTNWRTWWHSSWSGSTGMDGWLLPRKV